MKVAVVSEWFSQGMGYAENCLPRAMTRIGHDAHLFTSDLQIYGTKTLYSNTYEKLLGPAIQSVGTQTVDGFLVHRMPRTSDQEFELKGLEEALISGGFDLIYGFEVNQALTRQLLRVRKQMEVKLFLESRLHDSVFRRRSGLRRVRQVVQNRSLGRSLARGCDWFFPVAHDVQIVLEREFGIPRSKIELQGLGVDDSVFFANPDDLGAEEIRDGLRLRTDDRLMLYTGRLTKDKGVDILLDAYSIVRADRTDIRLLLVGEGELYGAAAKCLDVDVWNFQSQEALASIYRAADVGIWPRQESTSRFDAAACGLPLVVPSDAGDLRRLPQGTVTFEPDNSLGLAHAMVEKVSTLPSSTRRKSLRGFQLEEKFSWRDIAARVVARV